MFTGKWQQLALEFRPNKVDGFYLFSGPLLNLAYCAKLMFRADHVTFNIIIKYIHQERKGVEATILWTTMGTVDPIDVNFSCFNII